MQTLFSCGITTPSRITAILLLLSLPPIWTQLRLGPLQAAPRKLLCICHSPWHECTPRLLLGHHWMPLLQLSVSPLLTCMLHCLTSLTKYKFKDKVMRNLKMAIGSIEPSMQPSPLQMLHTHETILDLVIWRKYTHHALLCDN